VLVDDVVTVTLLAVVVVLVAVVLVVTVLVVVVSVSVVDVFVVVVVVVVVGVSEEVVVPVVVPVIEVTVTVVVSVAVVIVVLGTHVPQSVGHTSLSSAPMTMSLHFPTVYSSHRASSGAPLHPRVVVVDVADTVVSVAVVSEAVVGGMHTGHRSSSVTPSPP